MLLVYLCLNWVDFLKEGYSVIGLLMLKLGRLPKRSLKQFENYKEKEIQVNKGRWMGLSNSSLSSLFERLIA